MDVVHPAHAAYGTSREAACTEAVRYRACVVHRAHAAGGSVRTVGNYFTFVTAIAYTAAVHIPAHAASFRKAAHIAVSDFNVLNLAAVDPAEQAGIVVAAAAVVQPADGVTLSVEGAGVCCKIMSIRV